MNILFFFKNLAGTLLMPFQLSLVLIVAGAVLLWLNRGRRLATYLVTAGAGLLLIFSDPFVSYHLAHDLEARYPPLRLTQSSEGGMAVVRSAPIPGHTEIANRVRDLGPAPFVVVLSGGASDDPGLPESDRLTSASALRVAEAAEIYRALASSSALATNAFRPLAKGKPEQHVDPRVILSGGQTLNTVPEAVPMQILAESLGIPADDIYMETQSDDTFMEAKDVSQIVGNKPVILVTSAIHMPRAVALFRHFGMHPVPAPANYIGQKTTEAFVMKILPSTNALDQSTAAWHERIGMFWEHLRGQL